MGTCYARLFVEQERMSLSPVTAKKKLDKTVKEIGKNVTGVQGDAGNIARPRWTVRDSQKREWSYRCRYLRAPALASSNATRLSYREMLRRYVQPQRSRDFVYRAKGSAEHMRTAGQSF